MPEASKVAYLVFDVETVADGDLVARLRYPGWNLDGPAAIARYKDEIMREHGNDFVPYTYQMPVALAVAKVGPDFRLLDIAALDEPQFRPHVIAEHFWSGWLKYGKPTFVTFNGRTFDLPVLEQCAFRYGIVVADWFGPKPQPGRSKVFTYDQPRYRYNDEYHLDLQDFLTNYGATRYTGGLNLAANLLGKPGKGEIEGSQVQDYFNKGKIQEINDYCRCDVLDTYFVFLRTRVLVGELALEKEQAIVAETKKWLEAKAGENAAYKTYLSRWGDWKNPRG